MDGAWLGDHELSEQLELGLRDYERRGGHVVVVGASALPYPAIIFDDHGMGVRMATHVATLENTSILILAGPENHPAMAARTRAYRTASPQLGSLRELPLNTAPFPAKARSRRSATMIPWPDRPQSSP